jgi:hypothetical protein
MNQNGKKSLWIKEAKAHRSSFHACLKRFQKNTYSSIGFKKNAVT